MAYHSRLTCRHCTQADHELETANAVVAERDREIAELHEALSARQAENQGLREQVAAAEAQGYTVT